MINKEIEHVKLEELQERMTLETDKQGYFKENGIYFVLGKEKETKEPLCVEIGEDDLLATRIDNLASFNFELVFPKFDVSYLRSGFLHIARITIIRNTYVREL